MVMVMRFTKCVKKERLKILTKARTAAHLTFVFWVMKDGINYEIAGPSFTILSFFLFTRCRIRSFISNSLEPRSVTQGPSFPIMNSAQNGDTRKRGKKRKRSSILIDTVKALEYTILNSSSKSSDDGRRKRKPDTIAQTYYRRTSDSFARYVNDSRKKYLLASGKSRTLYDNVRDHICTRDCDFWASDVPCNHIWDLYLCKMSLNAHPCGSDCECYVDANDGMSCYLTGKYLGVVVENNLKRMKCWKDDDICYTPPSKRVRDDDKSFSHKLEVIREGEYP